MTVGIYTYPMCLILFAIDRHPRYRLVLAANRDEFLDRPTRPAAPWPDAGGMVAGKDLKAGGAWFGVAPGGRWAALSNYRAPDAEKPGAPSRGMLVRDFLAVPVRPADYLEGLRDRAGEFSGFNLLVGDAREVRWFSHAAGEERVLTPGLYGLSNHLLDTPWPKVERGKAWLATLLQQDAIDPNEVFDGLRDETPAPDEHLPDTGVGLEWERRLSPMFIRTPRYGTRCSSLILIDRDGNTTFYERTYPPDGGAPVDVSYALKNEKPGIRNHEQ